MSEAIKASEEVSAKELLELLQRLVSLAPTETKSRFGLDDILTTKECAEWLKRSPIALNAEAKAYLIPAIRAGKTEFRFHPRTILEAAHRRYFNLNGGRTK